MRLFINLKQINNSKDRGKSKSGIQMVYRHLMNGVSFMVPFIVVGGLLYRHRADSRR